MTKVRVGGKSTVSERGTFRPGVQSIVAGTNISIDNTDPQNPVVSSTGGGGGGSGDVTGPAGAVNNNFAIFSGTTGKIIKDFGSTPSDGDFVYRESGAWVKKTTNQIKAILGVNLMPYAADTPNASITGTTNQTVLASIYIPAGTILAGDIIRIKALVSKTGTAGTLTNRIVFNTTNDVNGSPITIGMFNGGGISGVFTIKAFREIFVNTLSVQYMSTSLTTNVVSDDGSFTAVATLPGIDFSADQYLLFTAQLGNSGDTGFLRGYTVEILR